MVVYYNTLSLALYGEIQLLIRSVQIGQFANVFLAALSAFVLYLTIVAIAVFPSLDGFTSKFR